MIASKILLIQAGYNKRLGAYKTTHVLQYDYGIHISVGRVYRLMKSLQLPKMSTEKSSLGTFQENQMLLWSWLRSKKLIKNETHHSVSCFILTGELNIPHLHSGRYWILLMLCNRFP